MNLKQNSHYKEGPPQYVKVHQIFLSGGPVVHQGKKVGVKPCLTGNYCDHMIDKE